MDLAWQLHMWLQWAHLREALRPSVFAQKSEAG